MGRAEPLELAPQHAHGLGGLERVYRRRPLPRVDERELAESIARASNQKESFFAKSGRALDREAAADDEVQRIGRIHLVKDDLARLFRA
jgi:hypothetical protein